MTMRRHVALGLLLLMAGLAAPAAAESQPAKAATAPQAAKAAPRRLEDIRIEGEIPVPQVLFITARDQRRFLDFRHRRYLKNSRQLGEQTVLPQRIQLTGDPVTEIRKESH
jgi:hypothetical protein